jgi:hypothetical protein
MRAGSCALPAPMQPWSGLAAKLRTRTASPFSRRPSDLCSALPGGEALLLVAAAILAVARLVLNAELHHEAEEAGALGDALLSLSDMLRATVAAGLCLFGAYSLIEARYRLPPAPRVKPRMADAFA